MSIIEWLILIPLFLFGRMSGGWLPKINKIASPCIGVCIGLILGIHDYWLLAFALAGYLGEKPGMGAPMGMIVDDESYTKRLTKELERWQPEFTRHRPRLALMIRGMISGIVYLPLTYIVGWGLLITIPAYMIGWQMMWSKTGKIQPILNGQVYSEGLRQVVTGLILIAL